jgi:pimeloyl-ACP methyl ester carboxylesterase
VDDLIRILSLAVVVVLFLAGAIAYRSYRREWAELKVPRQPVGPAPQGSPFEDLEDVAALSAGHVVRGWYVPPRNGTLVVLTHGSGANRRQVLPQAAILVRHGYGVFLFDWPGMGDSGGTVQYGRAESDALRSVLELVKRRARGARLGAYGVSLGACIVVDVAVGRTDLEALALESLPTDLDAAVAHANRRWGRISAWPALFADRRAGIRAGTLRPVDSIPRLGSIPLFLVTGAEDPIVPPSMASTLSRKAPGPCELWVVPGGGHGDAVTSAPAEFEERLVAFFDRFLLDRSLPSSSTTSRSR